MPKISASPFGDIPIWKGRQPPPTPTAPSPPPPVPPSAPPPSMPLPSAPSPFLPQERMDRLTEMQLFQQPAPTYQPRLGGQPSGEVGGMTYEEVKAEADRVGGRVGYSAARGYYVIPAGQELGPEFYQPGAAPERESEYARRLRLGLPTMPSLGKMGKPTEIRPDPSARPEWVPKWAAWGPPKPKAGAEPADVMKEVPGETPEEAGAGGIAMAERWDTRSEGGWDYLVGYDAEGNVVSKNMLGRTEETKGITPYQEETLAQQRELLEFQKAEADRKHEKGLRDAKTDADERKVDEEYRQEMLDLQKEEAKADEAWRKRQTEQAAMGIESERANTQMMIDWYRQQQQAQLEAERQQRLAQLQANPASWLEYAALSGQPPAIQPWMLPLAHEEYGFQLGEAVPGWTGEGQVGGLPELQTPSAQYLARMSPSARQQFYGYRGARTGQTPSDIQYQLWAGAPPGGGYGGMRQLRYER